MTTQLHAQPYNQNATGFNFRGISEYQTQANNHLDAYGNIVEEFEIQFIDGDDAELFKACKIDQTSLDTWFNDVEVLDETDKINLFYLVGCAGYTLEQGLDKIQEPSIYYGELIDAATELFNECMLPEVPESIRSYIDYEKFARDCQLGGDMVEFDYQNTTYTCTNANGL